jgi:formate dehydrogenase subunit gamma
MEAKAIARLRRFSKTERAAHWLVAAAFAVMLFSGGQVPHRWRWTTPALDVHVGAAVVLVFGLAGLTLFGNRGALRTTAGELRRLDATDRAWLAPARILLRRPAPPVGRFNGGQKLNARLALLGLTGLYATGIYLLTFGRGAFGHLHGPFAFLTTALIVAHIFMAVVNPSTRHALRGMTLGTVNRDWAEHHFPRWVAETDRARLLPVEAGPGVRLAPHGGHPQMAEEHEGRDQAEEDVEGHDDGLGADGVREHLAGRRHSGEREHQ